MTGRLAAARRRLALRQGTAPPAWQLRVLPVCASTERELDRWLADAPGRLERPRAVVARRQRFGHGQAGRTWLSPTGGVWLSAALPWPEDPAGAAAPALAVAVGLALQLEDLGLEPRLKWPNDLLLPLGGGAWGKVAGILPGLRRRGTRVRWARAGVGLNGRNRVPAGAARLMEAIGPAQASPVRLGARLLSALEWAMEAAPRPEQVRALAEHRLLPPRQPLLEDGEAWWPVGLSREGGLLVERNGRRRVLHRWPPIQGNDGGITAAGTAALPPPSRSASQFIG